MDDATRDDATRDDATKVLADRSPYEFGDLLRRWREERKVSQLALASRAGVSARHLSFVENGRSAPSPAMVLRLAEHLDVPLRERNRMLLAAGFAPAYGESPIQSPELAMVRSAVRRVLTGHEPYPAVLVDRSWNLVEANGAVAALFTDGAPADLLAEPFNVLRFSLHPRGLAPRIRNLAQWREHILGRLERQLRLTVDEQIRQLHQELLEYPGPEHPDPDPDPGPGPGPEHPDPEVPHSGIDGGRPGENEPSGNVVVPILLEHDGRTLSLFSTVTTFGTPRDITVQELAIESFYPADQDTADQLWKLAAIR